MAAPDPTGAAPDPRNGADPAAWNDELDPALDLAFGADAAAEFDSLGSEQDDDEHLAQIVAQATSTSGREHVSALSALSQQLSAYPPLPPEEQFIRLEAYQEGLAAAARLAQGGLSWQQAREAQRIVAAGQRAQTELVGSMYRLALMMCREQAAERYGRERMLDMLADLVGEANIAVVEAIGKFDPQRSPSFNLYAGRVIRDRVRSVLANSATVGVQAAWLRIKRIYTTLRPEVEMRLGRTPTEAEMQEELRLVCMRWAADRLTVAQQALPEKERTDLMLYKLRKQGMLGAIKRLPDVLATTQHIASLDAPVGDGEGARLGDLLAEADSSARFAEVEHEELRRDLAAALGQLTERERSIVMLKYGFVDGEQWTYAKLAPKFGVSAERIRQIERNALAKLRLPGFPNLAPHLPTYEP